MKYAFFLNSRFSKNNVSLSISKEKTYPLVKKFKRIYVVDGGYRHYLKLGLSSEETIFIGDNDSARINDKKRQSFHKSLLLSPLKNLSDFAFSLEHLKSSIRSKENIFIEVFSGLYGSKSHELSNILEAVNFIESSHKNVVFIFHPKLVITNRTLTLEKMKNKHFSIISFKKNSEVIIHGMSLYHGPFSLERPSHGISNISYSERIKIEPKNNTLLISL